MFFISDSKQTDSSLYIANHQKFIQLDLNDEKAIESYKKTIHFNDIFMNDYPLLFPLSLNYYTYKADEPDTALIETSIDPDAFIYYTLEKTSAAFFQSNIKLHRHNFYELMFTFDGEFYQTIEHSRHLYSKGCACLMNKNVHHREEYSDYSRVVFLKISEDFIFSLLNSASLFNNQSDIVHNKIRDFFDYDTLNHANKSYIDFVPIEAAPETDCIHSANKEKQNKIYRLFDSISMLLCERTALASAKISALVYEMLYVLFDENLYSPTPIRIGTAKQRDLFDQIDQYIHLKKGNLSRNELGNRFNYSGDYLYRIIGKYTGMSISDYCMLIRMQFAAEMLTNTTKTAQEICTELGFTNKTQFYDAFKKRYGMTPHVYRKDKSSKSAIPQNTLSQK